MYATFQGDPALEKGGVWFDYGNFRIRAAYAGGANKSYQQSLETRTKHIRRGIQTGAVSAEVLTNILIDAYADSIITDWETIDENTGEWKKGIEAPDGSIIPFNRDNVVKTLKALPNLFENIKDGVGNSTLYRKGELEDEGKN